MLIVGLSSGTIATVVKDGTYRDCDWEIVERLKKQRSRELMGKLLSFMFWRFPLFGLDKWLDPILPFIRACTGRVAGLVWLAACGLGFGHQGRVEARVVVHLELAIDLKVGAACAAVGKQTI